MQTVTTESTIDTEAQPLRVGIQGYPGAFHDIASRQYFGARNIEIIPAHTFSKLLAAVSEGEKMDIALMAIENTLAGSIMTNYQLLLEKDLVVTGEVFLRVEQNLMVNPGVKIEDLKEVHSHPVAIAQCKAFFRQHPHIHLVETVDTALSAKEVSIQKSQTIGAIASNRAAEIYGLEMIHKSIETNKGNHTRFFVLEKSPAQLNPAANKVSLSISLDHEVGSLHKILAVLAAYNVNLTKIQSAPIIGKPWEYRFFIDFVSDGAISAQQAIEGIRPIIKGLKIFGIYPEGEKSSLFDKHRGSL